MKKITDRDFEYTPAASTDIRKRFDKVAPGWNQKPKPKTAQDFTTARTLREAARQSRSKR